MELHNFFSEIYFAIPKFCFKLFNFPHLACSVIAVFENDRSPCRLLSKFSSFIFNNGRCCNEACSGQDMFLKGQCHEQNTFDVM